MAATLPILRDVVARIQQQMPDIEVRLFPDDPAKYSFTHPKGAVLVGYQGGSFERPHDIEAVVQQRNLTLHLTLFGRGLHNESGTLPLLDRLRLALTGHKPPDCNKIHLLSESFLSEAGGVWQYELRAQTETQQIEQQAEDTRPRVSNIYLYRDGSPPPHNLNSKQP